MLSHILALPVVRYFWVAATGFVLDVALFAVFHLLMDMSPLPANLTSATIAVAFVYFTSAHRIFYYKGHMLLPKFAAYLTYQATVIILFSALIAWLATTLNVPALSVKIGIVPLQFVMNYVVLKALLRLFEKQ